MIDTHAHLNFPELLKDLDAVLTRSQEAGINKILVPATNVQTSTSSVDLSEKYDQIYSAVGIHPCEVRAYTEGDRVTLNELLSTKKRIVSIGEVGLDYYHLEDLEGEEDIARYKEEQGRLFMEMIHFAQQFYLPIIVHNREAFDDTFSILQSINQPSVIHCFTGTLQQAQAWVELGAMISFTGILTYKKNTELREVVKQIPLEYIMTETDAPYLAPEGFRGQVAEPRFVREVAACIAEIKGISLEEVDRITTDNAEEFFKLY